MQVYRMGSYILTFVQVMAVPLWLSAQSYMKDTVEESKKNPGKSRWMVGGPLLVIIMMGTMLLQIPASVNEVYEVHQGVVTECKKYQYGISLGDFNGYMVVCIDSDTQKEKVFDQLASKNIEVGDQVEVREYIAYSIPVKINGIETDYEKEGPYIWGDVATDRGTMTIIIMTMVLIHFVQYIRNRKIRCMTRKGIVFWKLWHCGSSMFSILLWGWVWIPVKSMLIGNIVGYALCVLYGVGEVCRYLYLLEKRGYVWTDERKKAKKEAEIEEKAAKLKEEQQRQLVQFQTLNYTRAKRYCEYKYAKKKRERNEMLLALEITWSMGAFIVVTLMDSQVKWLITGGVILLFLITPILLFRRFAKKNGWLQSAAEYGVEYAVTMLDIHEEKIFVYTDGQEEICKMEFDDEVKAKDGTLVVIVRTKAKGKTFTETMETWDYISVPKE